MSDNVTIPEPNGTPTPEAVHATAIDALNTLAMSHMAMHERLKALEGRFEAFVKRLEPGHPH